MRIFLDLHEVLADFRGGASQALDVSQDAYPPGVWHIPEALNIPPKRFTRTIQAKTARWWSNLEPLPWCHELFTLVKALTDDWYIITSPFNNSQSLLGSYLWVKRFLEVDPWEKVIPTKQKHLLANPDAILIDDREETVGRFNIAGGYGIVFPSIGNSLHKLSRKPLSFVVPELDRVFSNSTPLLSD